MNQELVTSFIKGANYVGWLTMLGICAWLLKQLWKTKTDKDDALADSLKSLAQSVGQLSDTLKETAELQARHDELLKEHGRQLGDLREGKYCLNLNCPLRTKEGL
jgi:hypothetical protein